MGRHAVAFVGALLSLAVGCATGASDDGVVSTRAAIDEVVAAPVSSSTAGSTSVGGSAPKAHVEGGVNLVEVLRRADFVGSATVVKLASRYGTQGRSNQEAIWTDITFRVDNAVKDARGVAAEGQVTLTFLGGTVDGRELHVEHFPTFQAGEQVILLAKSDERPCPTFAGEYGVLRVRDGRVFTSYGHPLAAITDRGYDVLTLSRDLPTAAPAPVAVAGDAGGELVAPAVGTEADAMPVDEALASLEVLVEVGR
ncbi:MAG: hypothetical protein R3A78_03945 [Polyangiales bacterium]|nr:hypothetical protein [Myxococcales bacterium]